MAEHGHHAVPATDADERPGDGRPARARGVATIDRESGGVRVDTTAAARRATRRRSPTPPEEAREGSAAGAAQASDGDRPPSGRRLRSLGRRLVAVAAVVGIAGTLLFGHAWAVQRQQAANEASVRSVANGFLLSLTNFDAKSIDADFNRVQSYATGSFASQANQFFGSTIRKQLEAALASSRGQVRDLFVQSASAGKATVFAVVDQTYVNAKMSAPAADVLRIVLDLASRPSGWKVADVTVLGSGSATSPTTSAGPAASSAPSGG